MTTPMELTDEQGTGRACIVCGKAPDVATRVPVGMSQETGAQLYACGGNCADHFDGDPVKALTAEIGRQTSNYHMALAAFLLLNTDEYPDLDPVWVWDFAGRQVSGSAPSDRAGARRLADRLADRIRANQ